MEPLSGRIINPRYKEMKKFNHNTEHIHELITLSSALNYQLRQAEETRKKIEKLSLKAKRDTKKI